jgi:sugar lactone lactonase YvrE
MLTTTFVNLEFNRTKLHMYRIKSAILFFLCFLGISAYCQTQYIVSNLAGDTANIYLGAGSNAGYRDGVASQALFNNPAGIAIDPTGNYLYVADVENNIIRKISLLFHSVSTLAGDTTDIKKGLDSNIGYINATNPLAAKFNNPWGICVDKTGNVYVADTYNNVIRKIATSGKITTYAGRDSAGTTFIGYVDGPDSLAEFFSPLSLTVDTAGNLYVTDYGNNAIREISASTHMVTTITGQGPDTVGYVNGPSNIAQLYGIYGIALAKTGAVYVSQFTSNYNAIRRVYHDTVTTYAGYDYIGFDTNVVLWQTVPNGYQNEKNTYGRAALYTTSVLFNDPTGIAFDTAGNLLIADEYNNVIRVFDTKDSIVSTLAGNKNLSIPGYVNGVDSVAEFSNPMGLAADKSGNFYVADLGNNTIRKISQQAPSGVSPVNKTISTLSVYPNPCTERLNIISSFNGKADLLDLTGRVVWTNTNFKSPYVLATSNISPGIYFLRITSLAITEIKKIEVLK